MGEAAEGIEEGKFEMFGVSEAEAAFEAEGNDVGEEGEAVARGVAVGAVGMGSEDGDMGPHEAVEVEAEGKDDADEDTFRYFWRKEEARSKGGPGGDAVKAVSVPDAAHGGEVKKLKNRDHDDSSEDSVREMEEEGREEEECEGDRGRSDK